MRWVILGVLCACAGCASADVVRTSFTIPRDGESVTVTFEVEVGQ